MSVTISGADQVGLTVESDPLALKIASNLSDINNAGTARTNLGVAYATNTQADLGQSTTTVVSPASLDRAKKSPSVYFYNFNSPAPATSGTGSSSAINSGTWLCQAPTTAAGHGMMTIYTIGSHRGVSSWVWSRPFTASFRWFDGSAVSDTNTVSRVLFGKNNSNPGDLTNMGVGITRAGNGFINLQVHNGTTLVNVPTSVNPGIANYHDFRIFSDGAGNIQLFINDVLAASSSGGPTGSTSQGLFISQESHNLAIITGNPSQTRLANLRWEFSV